MTSLTPVQYAALRAAFPGRMGDEVQSFVETHILDDAQWIVTSLRLNMPHPPPEGEPHPERTPVGPFASRDEADRWAEREVRRYGGGSWTTTGLRSPLERLSSVAVEGRCTAFVSGGLRCGKALPCDLHNDKTALDVLDRIEADAHAASDADNIEALAIECDGHRDSDTVSGLTRALDNLGLRLVPREA